MLRLAASVVLLGLSIYSAALVAEATRTMATADIDGDGKQDRIYRIDRGKGSIEVAVYTSKNGGKKFKVFQLSHDEISEITFSAEERKKFIYVIRCRDDCSSNRSRTIDLLNKSKSAYVFAIESDRAGSVIFVNERGKVVQEWYAD